MTSISFLGTGSGIPSAGSFFSSAVLSVAGGHLLVDAGEPCVHLLCERGELIRDIDAVLITHGHVDLIGGVPALLQGAMLLGRTKQLGIYLPGEMIAPLRAWIRALFLTEEGLGFPLLWMEWKDGEPMLLENAITVIPHANKHLENCYHTLPGADFFRSCESFSLEILNGDFRAIFSGDLSSATDLSALVAQPVTVLVSELSHFSTDELVGVLHDASIRYLCLVHLSEEIFEGRSELHLKMEDLLPHVEDIMFPEDGEVIDF